MHIPGDMVDLPWMLGGGSQIYDTRKDTAARPRAGVDIALDIIGLVTPHLGKQPFNADLTRHRPTLKMRPLQRPGGRRLDFFFAAQDVLLPRRSNGRTASVGKTCPNAQLLIQRSMLKMNTDPTCNEKLLSVKTRFCARDKPTAY